MNTIFTLICLLLVSFLLILVLAFAITILTHQGRGYLRTIGLIFQIIPDSPIRPLEWITKSPTREIVSFPGTKKGEIAHIYRTVDSTKRPAILLFLGINPAGLNDSRVVNLSESLARSGLVVMVARSENMTDYKIDPNAVGNIIKAFQYLYDLEYTDQRKIGMGGFCVGASLSAVAAQDFRIRDKVSFLNLFGAYADARNLMSAVASRTRFYENNVHSWNPSEQAWLTFRNHLIDSVEHKSDRVILEKHHFSPEPTKSENDDTPTLISEEAIIVHQILEGVTLEQSVRLLDNMPNKFLMDLDRISPIHNIENLKANVLIMHDSNDTNIPADESRRLANAIQVNGQVYYTEFSIFDHMDPTRSVGQFTWAKEVMQLFLHLNRLLKIAKQPSC